MEVNNRYQVIITLFHRHKMLHKLITHWQFWTTTSVNITVFLSYLEALFNALRVHIDATTYWTDTSLIFWRCFSRIRYWDVAPKTYIYLARSLLQNSSWWVYYHLSKSPPFQLYNSLTLQRNSIIRFPPRVSEIGRVGR